MTMRFFASCVLGTSPFMVSAIAQEQVDKPPVPVLSVGGTAPAGAENSYVFIDPRTEDAVAFYTEDGRAAGANPFGPSVIRVDIKLSRHVEPSMRSVLTRDANAGTYQYRYELLNGAGARQIAWKWLLDGVDGMDLIRVQTPASWTHRFPVTRAGNIEIPAKLKNADPSFRSLRLLAVDARGVLTPNQGVKPGGGMAGFELISRRIPGVIQVLVEGDFNVPTFPNEPPAAASQQVATLLRSPYNYGRTFTIGPRFPPGTGQATIGKSYLQDIQELENARSSNVSSDFTVELKTFLRSEDLQNLTGLDKASSVADTSFERELIKGVREALAAGVKR